MLRLPLRLKDEDSPWGDASADMTAEAVLQVLCVVHPAGCAV
jgi:hypothetical protein